ncbi:MAG TPA: glycine cleavage system protein GcvH, partial [Candidatus Ratteibacteria bacterium]|nr:glycine cleavage system protein GcvH [Candidatus Ratteibacteria bacterium]
SLGDIVFVELPEVGRKVKQFETCGTIESIKAASDIFSPISGKIIEVNENLKETPEIINKSPYESWLFKIEVEDEKEKENLMNEVEYQQYIKNL